MTSYDVILKKWLGTSIRVSRYALRFVLSYDGPNPVILRLQMRVMLWAMKFYHRNGNFLFHPDYLSRLGADLHFCELTRTYLNKTINLRQLGSCIHLLLVGWNPITCQITGP